MLISKMLMGDKQHANRMLTLPAELDEIQPFFSSPSFLVITGSNHLNEQRAKEQAKKVTKCFC